MKAIRAAVYVRISRPDEAEILVNQKRAATEYCDRRDFDLVEVYEDIASGGSTDRPGLNRLLEDAGAGKFDLVVFTALSRMTRGGVDGALYLLKRLELVKVGWHFVEQPILNFDDTTPPLGRDIILAVLAAVDQDYRRRISVSTKAALARKKQAGGQLGRHKKGCTCPIHKGKKIRGPGKGNGTPSPPS